MSELEHTTPELRGDLAARLRALTPARVGLGRTGVSLETRDRLDFERCHALARDAVHARFESAALAAELSKLTGGETLPLHSAASDRTTYLQRPDLGRILDEPSRKALGRAARAGGCELALVVADGLSALAVARHAAPLLAELLPQLNSWKLAPSCLVEQGRVAIGDEIGAALGAEIAVVLIGERPGLNPRPGRTDAERNCISNIRPEGLPYAQAAAELAYILNEARRLRLTGVALKAEARRLGQ
jgi:ethanolamine ammonia-lyase small subunit